MASLLFGRQFGSPAAFAVTGLNFPVRLKAFDTAEEKVLCPLEIPAIKAIEGLRMSIWRENPHSLPGAESYLPLLSNI